MYLFAVTRTKKGYFEMMPKYGSVRLDDEDEKYRRIKEFTKTKSGKPLLLSMGMNRFFYCAFRSFLVK